MYYVFLLNRTMFPILQNRTNQESFERDQIKNRTTDSQETYSVENNHSKPTNTWALPITFLGVIVTVSSIYILCIYIKSELCLSFIIICYGKLCVTNLNQAEKVNIYMEYVYNT